MIRQFDVVELRGGQSAATVVVPPAAAPRGFIVQIRVGNDAKQVLLSQMASVPLGELGRAVGSAAVFEDELRRGVDRLLTGF